MYTVGFLTLFLTSLAFSQEENVVVSLGEDVEMEFVWINPGTFFMGTDSLEVGYEYNEGPRHEVTISKGFYLGKYELTQAQWEIVMGTTPWKDWADDFELRDVRIGPNYPALAISWRDVHQFIHRLNQAAGDSLYRLPTEAEWEYACRAGTTTPWSFGADRSLLGEYAWYRGNTLEAGEPYAQQVGTKLPNPWGLYDMHGNAQEWVQDWMSIYSISPAIDPTGPASGESRAMRGGTYRHSAWGVRCASRSQENPDFRSTIYPYVGARIVKMGMGSTAVVPKTWGAIKEGTGQ